MTTLASRIQEGAVFGPFSKTNDPMFVEITGKSGFDFIILDTEHGPNSPRQLYPLILAAQANGLHPIVRVGSLSSIEIHRILDLGVAGVQIPQIESPEEAKTAVRTVKFHPLGTRGVCRYVRAADYSMKDRSLYFSQQNTDIATIIHVEGARGVSNIDAIIQVEGIDVIFIGPYDLSQSLGVPGETGHPIVMESIEKVVQQCRKAHKSVGIFAENPEKAKIYETMGIHYISYSVDVGIYAEGCRSIIQSLRGIPS